MYLLSGRVSYRVLTTHFYSLFGPEILRIIFPYTLLQFVSPFLLDFMFLLHMYIHNMTSTSL